MSKCAPDAPRQEPFDDRIDSLFRELELAIQWQRPSILFAVYGAAPAREEADLALEGRLIDLGQKVFRFQVRSEEDADVAARLAKVDDPQATVFFVSGLENGGGEDGLAAYAALNKQREFFIDQAVRVVFWLSEAEAVDLANAAPDYWAYRHRVIEFVDLPEQKRPRSRPQADVPATPEPVAASAADPDSDAVALPQTAGLLNSLGGVYLRLGRDEDALQSYRKALEAEPRGAHHWNGLGNVFYKTGAYAEAVAAYEKAVELADEPGRPYANLALAYSAKGQPEKAVPLYLKGLELLESDKEKAITWNRLGDAYRKLNDRRHALAAYQKAVELDADLKTRAPAAPAAERTAVPAQAEAHTPAPAAEIDEWRRDIPVANSLVADGADTSCNEPAGETPAGAFPDGAEEDPMEKDLKTAAEWNALGHSHMSAGNYDEAIEAYTRAIELAEERHWPYIRNLARAHYHKGEHHAKSDLPTEAEDAGQPGELPEPYQEPPTRPLPGGPLPEEDDDQPDPAVPQPEAPVPVAEQPRDDSPLEEPEPVELPLRMGGWLDALEDEQTDTFNRSRSLDGDWLADARKKFGLDLADQEEDDEPAADGEPAASQPAEPDPSTLADTIQMPARRPAPRSEPEAEPQPEVLAVTEEAEQPRDAMEWNERGNIHLKAGACDRAIEAYIKSIELAPDFGWPYSNLGLAYSHKGKYAEAIPLYRKSIELLETKKEKAIAWNRMGDAYRRLNDHKNAVAAYQKAVELDAGTSSLLKRVRLSLLGNARA